MAETEETGVRARPHVRGAAIVLVGLTLVSALSLAGALWWVLDLLSHFHAIYFLLAVVAGVVMAALRWWKLAAWAGALVAFEGMLLLPLYPRYGGADEPVPGSPRLRVVSYNMQRTNPRTPEAAAHIASLEPDVVVLLEVTDHRMVVVDLELR